MKREIILALFLFAGITSAFAAQVETVFVMSKSTNKSIGNLVIKPDSYSKTAKRFPVLYLLHGAGDNYKGWLAIAPDLPADADRYNMIIVCADGGSTSWYFDSPIDPKYKYETYIAIELVQYI